MDIILKNAYTEVNQVIELLGEPYKNKIPKQIINFFYENRNINYKANISKNIPIEDIEISRTALIIISILNLKYWETDENKKEELDIKLQMIREHLSMKPEAAITYFVPDSRKAGGSYLQVSGIVKKVDEREHLIIMEDGTSIPFHEIYEIRGSFAESIDEIQ